MDAARRQHRGLQVPHLDRDEVGAWLGGAVIWGAMTGAITRQVKPALATAGVVGASAIGRLVVRGALPSDGPDAGVVASGTLRGALMGAAVGACLASGRPGAVPLGDMLRLAAKGTGIGAAIGAGAGAVEAATDTFLM
jgi:hypothetical protein